MPRDDVSPTPNVWTQLSTTASTLTIKKEPVHGQIEINSVGEDDGSIAFVSPGLQYKQFRQTSLTRGIWVRVREDGWVLIIDDD